MITQQVSAHQIAPLVSGHQARGFPGMAIATAAVVMPWDVWAPFATAAIPDNAGVAGWTNGDNFTNGYLTLMDVTAFSNGFTSTDTTVAALNWINGYGSSTHIGPTNSQTGTPPGGLTMVAPTSATGISGDGLIITRTFSGTYLPDGVTPTPINIARIITLSNPTTYSAQVKRSLDFLKAMVIPEFLPKNPNLAIIQPPSYNTGSDVVSLVYPDASGNAATINLPYPTFNNILQSTGYLLGAAIGKYQPGVTGQPLQAAVSSNSLRLGSANHFQNLYAGNSLVSLKSDWKITAVGYGPVNGLSFINPVFFGYRNPTVPAHANAAQPVAPMNQSFQNGTFLFDPISAPDLIGDPDPLTGGPYGEMGFQAQSF